MTASLKNLLFKNSAFMKAFRLEIKDPKQQVLFNGKAWTVGNKVFIHSEQKINVILSLFARIAHTFRMLFSNEYKGNFIETEKRFKTAIDNSKAKATAQKTNQVAEVKKPVTSPQVVAPEKPVPKTTVPSTEKPAPKTIVPPPTKTTPAPTPKEAPKNPVPPPKQQMEETATKAPVNQQSIKKEPIDKPAQVQKVESSQTSSQMELDAFLLKLEEQTSVKMRELWEGLFNNIFSKCSENWIISSSFTPTSLTLNFKDPINFWMPSTNSAGNPDPNEEPNGGAVFTFAKQLVFNTNKKENKIEITGLISTSSYKLVWETWPDAYILRVSIANNLVTIVGKYGIEKSVEKPLDKTILVWKDYGEKVNGDIVEFLKTKQHK